MTVLEAIKLGADFLAKKQVESPRLQTELLLAHVLKLPRMRLYLDFSRELTEPETSAVREFVRRRGQREPLQHIVGTSNFCGFELNVNKHVLVPRPETELLAEEGWKFLQSLSQRKTSASSDTGPSAKALDIGTGSGCLAITLAAKCPEVQVWAIDLSSEALTVAKENAANNGLASRIVFAAGDLFAALPEGIQFDLLISNPPYISLSEIQTLDPEVRDHDPLSALDGGPDGLAFYHRLAAGAGPYLRAGGKFMFEFGDGQSPALQQIFEQQNWIVEAIREDYTARPRLMIVRKD